MKVGRYKSWHHYSEAPQHLCTRQGEARANAQLQYSCLQLEEMHWEQAAMAQEGNHGFQQYQLGQLSKPDLHPPPYGPISL